MPEVSIEWEAPPKRFSPGRPPSEVYTKIVEALAEQPNQWAKIATYANASSASALAGRINAGEGAFAPAGQYEALSRGEKVYARFADPTDPEYEAPAKPGRKAKSAATADDSAATPLDEFEQTGTDAE
jgi:hypothetical protein